MTTQKTFKQRVRARSTKTGESYTAARAQLLRKADPAAGPAGPAIDAMELTGVSEAAMRRATGRGIAEWLEILDAWGAREQKHSDIARRLVGEHGIPGWWAQNVTVGYERARGMRVRHQDSGGFSVTASRTISTPAERISDAFTDEALRSRWLPDAPISIRTANRGRSARFDWDEPPSRVGFNLFPKGEGKTQIGLEHEKLPDADVAAHMKAMWRERLTALKDQLESS
jgi:uncharacterized protein YndB with AHSA1/START domain